MALLTGKNSTLINILVIVKLTPDGGLIGTAHTYLPNGIKSQSNLILQR